MLQNANVELIAATDLAASGESSAQPSFQNEVQSATPTGESLEQKQAQNSTSNFSSCINFFRGVGQGIKTWRCCCFQEGPAADNSARLRREIYNSLTCGFFCKPEADAAPLLPGTQAPLPQSMEGDQSDPLQTTAARRGQKCGHCGCEICACIVATAAIVGCLGWGPSIG